MADKGDEMSGLAIAGIVILVFLFLIIIGGSTTYACRDQIVMSTRGTSLEDWALEMKDKMDALEVQVKDMVDKLPKPPAPPTTTPFANLRLKEGFDGSFDEGVVAVLAPWCGHCNKLKESGALDQVAKQVKTVVMDDKDSRAGEVMKMVRSEGFPTIAFVSKGKAPQQYNGDRSAQDILNKYNQFKRGG